MPRRGTRKRVAEGIYRDATGYEVTAKVGKVQRSKRYPPEASMRTMRDWRLATIAALKHATPPRPHTGLLGTDAEDYIGQMRHLAGFVSRRSEVRAWVALYGKVPRSSITAADVRMARLVWLENGVSPKTVNNRVFTLQHLYRVLDGAKAPTPCDDISPLPVPKTVPQVVDAETIVRVDQALQRFEQTGRLRTAKARARFRVFVTTGKRPSEIMRAQPEHVDFARRVWIPVDGKGGFCPGVYLNDDMLAAWQLFAEAKAWGYFREGSWVRTLRRAGWPEGLRLYQARHTVGILMSEAGIDLADIQAHLGHKQIATTRKTYVPVRGSRMQRASEVLAGRLQWRGPDAEPDDTARTATSHPADASSPRGEPE